MKLFKSSDANDLIQLHQSSQFALAEKKAKALLEDFPQEIILHNVLGVSLEAQKKIQRGGRDLSQHFKDSTSICRDAI